MFEITPIFFIIFFVFILSGWFVFILPFLGSKGEIIIFLLVTYIFFYLNIKITPYLEINIGGYIIPIFLFLFLLLSKKNIEKIKVLTATLLLGAI